MSSANLRKCKGNPKQLMSNQTKICMQPRKNNKRYGMGMEIQMGSIKFMWDLHDLERDPIEFQSIRVC